MKTATFSYKCRRCGELSPGLTTSLHIAKNLLLHHITGDAMVTAMERNWLGGSMFRTSELHSCTDGVGITDLVGYTVEVMKAEKRE